MADRKAELEKKRKKLEELKRARELSKQQAKDKEVTAATATNVEHLAKERKDIDKLVTDLIGGGSSPAVAPSNTSNTTLQDKVEVARSTPGITTALSSTSNRSKVKLVIDELAAINIRPKDVEVYAKETQTDAVCIKDIKAEEEEDEEDKVLTSSASAVPVSRHEDDTIEPEKEFTTPKQVEMSQEQLDRIMLSEDFSVFVERTSRLMERALCDSSDILFDQVLVRDSKETLSSRKLVKKTVFVDERWSQNRNVTAMDWSGQHPSLLLVSYYTNPNIPHDPDGVALLWDLKFDKKTPDYIFNCQSPVMSIAFSKFHPNYVIGGTYSGQIVLWDLRSGKRTPIQRSPLSSTSHTHPVYCLDMVGSPNAHNLISISTDGKMCSWNLDMLSQPQESLELQNRGTRPVAVTSMSFATHDVNKFLVGSEECVVYQGQRHGAKPGTSIHFEGHTGPITAVRSHRAAAGAQVDLSHIFLTSSFDWTMKMWTSKLLSERQITSKVGVPLCSLESNSEYIYDVQWSPVHPAVLASADGEGKIDIWNLNLDSEVPVLTENLDASASKVCWSPSGQNIAAGDFEGKVHIYEAGEALWQPQPDDWSRMEKLVEEWMEAQEVPGAALS